MIKNRIALAALLGVGVILTAHAQAPAPANPTPDPNAASSPHQRSVTGQFPGDATTTDSSSPNAASSPHQRAVAKGEGAGEKMAAGDGLEPATFVKKAAQGGMTEVALSRAAATQAQDPKVRKFANQMVADHKRANDELAGIAKRKGLNVPASLDAEHQSVVQRINSKSGSEFDSAYSKQMMSDHEKTVALFEGATKSADPDLAAFAKQTLPTLQEHKHMADELPGAMHAANSGEPAPQRK
jgi:putative membrane protein